MAFIIGIVVVVAIIVVWKLVDGAADRVMDEGFEGVRRAVTPKPEDPDPGTRSRFIQRDDSE